MDFRDLPNLASTQLGSRIVFATDEWFASAGCNFNLL
jgi:allantoicase